MGGGEDDIGCKEICKLFGKAVLFFLMKHFIAKYNFEFYGEVGENIIGRSEHMVTCENIVSTILGRIFVFHDYADSEVWIVTKIFSFNISVIWFLIQCMQSSISFSFCNVTTSCSFVFISDDMLMLARLF